MYRSNRFWKGVFLIIFLSIGLKLLLGFHAKIKNNKGTVPLVQVAKASIQSMPILLQAPGVMEAEYSVAITPQVTGIIKHIAFNQGDTLKKGQLLFEIEPASFIESLNQAKAVLLRDQATLKQNEMDAARNSELAKLEYVTKQQAEQAMTVARAQKAVVGSDSALVRQAEIQLSYTKIYATLEGKVGNVTVREGDLVVANSPTPLATINQLDKLWVNFNLTQVQLSNLMKYQNKAPIQIQIQSEEGGQILGKGEIVFIDNTVDTQTGTVLLKAGVDNIDYTLWPGMTVIAQLILTVEPNAVVIPLAALQIDQIGYYVYCVEKNKATKKRVEFSRQIKDLAVIAKGLAGTETIITSLPPGLSDGTIIRTTADKKETMS